MKIEKDEDTFAELKQMALDIHLESRNYNNEVIGIEYYRNFSVLTNQELIELEQLWHHKVVTCLKEKLASQWMIVQMCLFAAVSIYFAWLSHPYAGVFAGVVGFISLIKIIEEDRVRIASKKLADARLVYNKLLAFMPESFEATSVKQEQPKTVKTMNKTSSAF